VVSLSLPRLSVLLALGKTLLNDVDCAILRPFRRCKLCRSL
jgi:hypothetical protein